MSRSALVAGVLAGCASQPVPVAPLFSTKPPVEPRVEIRQVEVRRPGDIDADQLRVTIEGDPVLALRSLGIPVDEFEPIAQKLYTAWKAHHPDPPQAPAPRPAPTPPPPDPEAPSAFDSNAWWCYSSRDGSLGRCAETASDCIGMRDRFVGPQNEICVPGETKIECNRRALDQAAVFKDLKQCEHQEHVACFARHHVLDNETEDFCAPTIRLCKLDREFVAKEQRDDWKIKSECVSRR